MVVRSGVMALACLIGIPIGQAVAQERDPYPPRIYAQPYPDELPPGYYRLPRRYYRRLPPGYDDRDVVVIERRGAYSGYRAAPEAPFVRRYYRVAPDPYADDDDPRPRSYVRRPYPGAVDPDDRHAAPEYRWPDRHAAVPRYQPQVPSQQSIAPTDRAGEPSSAADLAPRLRRQIVDYRTKEPAGTIVVDTRNTYLYYVLGDGRAVRYGIGVGRDGFRWSGREKISRMAEWPDWYPPKDMLERQPYLPRMMAGGPGNPLGARALYLGNTLFRIHGTSDASSIGNYVSSGCIRLLNGDIADLYERVKVGTRVVVLRGGKRPATASISR